MKAFTTSIELHPEVYMTKAEVMEILASVDPQTKVYHYEDFWGVAEGLLYVFRYFSGSMSNEEVLLFSGEPVSQTIEGEGIINFQNIYDGHPQITSSEIL